MSTYVFGDIQGCFDELQKLLGECQYNKHKDQLWFVGDLINRGPKNLETMKFILELDDPVIVLGNHDLHFLAVANNIHPGVENDTIQDILDSAERKDIIEFLWPISFNALEISRTKIFYSLFPVKTRI